MIQYLQVEQLIQTLHLIVTRWLVSGKYATGGPLNFRFMYAQADDYEGTATVASGNDNLKHDLVLTC